MGAMLWIWMEMWIWELAMLGVKEEVGIWMVR